jgi:hypothetical protein
MLMKLAIASKNEVIDQLKSEIKKLENAVKHPVTPVHAEQTK